MDDPSEEHVLDEWEISKVKFLRLLFFFRNSHLFFQAIISDNVKKLAQLIPRGHFDEQKLKYLKTFEPNLDLLSTAAKHCKIEICKYLLENYRQIFGKLTILRFTHLNRVRLKVKQKTENVIQKIIFQENLFCLILKYNFMYYNLVQLNKGSFNHMI